MPPSEVEGFSDLNVEHGEINDERAQLFHYPIGSGHFLDVIEEQYEAKLSQGKITEEYFRDAMVDYVRSGQSGSRGSLRQREADHVVQHVLSKVRWGRGTRLGTG